MAVAIGELVSKSEYPTVITPFRTAIQAATSEEFTKVLLHDYGNFMMFTDPETVCLAKEDPNKFDMNFHQMLQISPRYIRALLSSMAFIGELPRTNIHRELQFLKQLNGLTVPLTPMAKNMRCDLRLTDGFSNDNANGLEFILYLNLVKNAMKHGVQIPGFGAPSNATYDPEAKKFHISNLSPAPLPADFAQPNVEEGHGKGMFIAHMYATLMGKKIVGHSEKIPPNGNPDARYLVSVNVQ